MSEQKIEKSILEVLVGDKQKNALEFVAYLKANEMLFERAGGYWADKLYWMIKFDDEYVCFVLINGGEDKTEPYGWIVWSDDSASNWLADCPLYEHMKEIAWKNVDICANCGSCKNPGGIRKTIFGKEFDNVCITTMKFINPDDEVVEFMKKMIELRKSDIQNNSLSV